PYVYVHSVKNQVLISQVFSSNYLEATILPGLTFRENVGISYFNNQREQYYPRTTYEGLSQKGLAYQTQGWYHSITTGSVLRYTSITSQTILAYTKTLGKHALNATAGFTYEDDQYRTKSQTASDFVNDLLQDNNMAGGQNYTQPQSNKGKSGLASLIGRVTDN